MPHNGYIVFNNKKLNILTKKDFLNIKDWIKLKKVYKN